MELRHLRYFVAVAEELNFTRAAERMHIGQPPLSMQIRDLEEEIGTPLFDREKRRVALTEAGRRFLDHARGILERSRAAVEEARRAGRVEAGELRIGFASSLAYTSTLADTLYRYRQRYPQVGLQLREMFTLDQLAALARRELDVGFVRHGGLEVPAGVGAREIGRDPLRLVVNAAHPLAGAGAVSLDQFRDDGFIAFPPDVGSGHRVLRDVTDATEADGDAAGEPLHLPVVVAGVDHDLLAAFPGERERRPVHAVHGEGLHGQLGERAAHAVPGSGARHAGPPAAARARAGHRQRPRADRRAAGAP